MWSKRIPPARRAVQSRFIECHSQSKKTRVINAFDDVAINACQVPPCARGGSVCVGICISISQPTFPPAPSQACRRHMRGAWGVWSAHIGVKVRPREPNKNCKFPSQLALARIQAWHSNTKAI